MNSTKQYSRRAFIRTAAVSIVGILVAACGTNPTATPVPQPTGAAVPPTTAPAAATKAPTAVPATSAPVTLRLRSFLDINGKTPREQAYKMAVDTFQAKNPTITIKPEQLPYDQLDPKMIIENEAGTAPEISFLSPQLIGKHAAAKSLLPLDPFIQQWPKSKLDEFYAKSVWDASVVDGKKLTMTLGIQTRCLYTRKDFLEKAGLPATQVPGSYDELVEMGKKLTSGGIYGLGLALCSERTTAEIYYSAALWGFGGDYLDQAGKPVFNSEAGIKALDWLRDLIYTHKIVPEAAINVRAVDLNDQFPQGRYAMCLEGSYRITGWLARGLNEQTLGAALWPSITPGKPGPIFTNGWDLGMPASIAPAKKEAAWKFISYFFEPEISKAYTLAEGSLPMLKSLLSDKEYDTPYHKVYSNVIATAARPLARSPWTSELCDMVVLAVQEVLTKKSDSKTALDKAAASFSKLAGI